MQVDPSLIRPLKRSEYERLAAEGAFEQERVELLQGTVVRMTPKGPLHENAIERATYLLVKALDDRARVRVQLSFAASEISQPEPDLALVATHRPPDAHPAAAFLVIEVSHSSLAIDRKVKSPIYAAAGVPEYWIVNLVDGVIEVSTEPRDGQFGRTTLARRGESIMLTAFPDVCIAVSDLLGDAVAPPR